MDVAATSVIIDSGSTLIFASQVDAHQINMVRHAASDNNVNSNDQHLLVGLKCSETAELSSKMVQSSCTWRHSSGPSGLFPAQFTSRISLSL